MPLRLAQRARRSRSSQDPPRITCSCGSGPARPRGCVGGRPEWPAFQTSVDPLPDIAVHVVKTPGIGRVAADLAGAGHVAAIVRRARGRSPRRRDRTKWSRHGRHTPTRPRWAAGRACRCSAAAKLHRPGRRSSRRRSPDASPGRTRNRRAARAGQPPAVTQACHWSKVTSVRPIAKGAATVTSTLGRSSDCELRSNQEAPMRKLPVGSGTICGHSRQSRNGSGAPPPPAPGTGGRSGLSRHCTKDGSSTMATPASANARSPAATQRSAQ